ncbi:hypothetical protein IKI14_04605 [bacterium]|nr:hypothetical protein [bacterium]
MVDLSSFDTSNIENMSSMFMDCRNLKTIYTSSSFVTSGLKAGDQYHSDMFLGDTKLV